LTRRQRQRNHRYIWRQLRARDRVIYFSYYANERVAWIRRRFANWINTGERNGSRLEMMRLFPEKFQRNAAASTSYRVQGYGGRITLFRAMLDYCEARGYELGWKPFAACGVDVVEVSGSHDEILKLPHVRMLARRLGQCLEDAQQNNSLDYQ
jgi:hypothetical protein